MRNPLARLRQKALTATPGALSLFGSFGAGFFASRSAYIDGVYLEAKSATYAQLYASQEYVRLVVDKIATVAADRSMRCYERHSDGSKTEDSNHPAAQSVRWPNDWQGQKELLLGVIKDKLIYEDAYLWDLGPDEDQRRFLVRIPPPSVEVGTTNMLKPAYYRIRFKNGQWLDLQPEEIIHFRGYSANSSRLGVSPMETLRTLLIETATRKAQSIEQVKGGLIKGGIIERPETAPEWSEEALQRFQESFSARLRGVATGKVSVLEEGMKFTDAGLTPREAEMLANRQFELHTVALVFGVNPAMFSTSGNLDAARRAMDEDVVDPLLSLIAETLTRQLINRRYNDRKRFFRFRQRGSSDIAKLAEAGTKLAGGAVMDADEVRDQLWDLPPSKKPLPTHPGSTSGSIPPKPGSADRGRPAESVEEEEKALQSEMVRLATDSELREKADRVLAQAEVQRRDLLAADNAAALRRHFRRMAKADANGKMPAFNRQRWDKELADDLKTVAWEAVRDEGNRTAARMGGLFDMVGVQNYLIEGSKRFAHQVNDNVFEAVSRAVQAGTPAADAYEAAIQTRADDLGLMRATQLLGFAALEAGKQQA